ncbi:hypothetical protein COCVIDRAFT_87365, partial [Bipolaris victoriae FI3]
ISGERVRGWVEDDGIAQLRRAGSGNEYQLDPTTAQHSSRTRQVPSVAQAETK